MTESNSNSLLSASEKLQPVMGVEHAGVIDLLRYDEASGEVVMVMVEKRQWEDLELQLFQLQEKLNAYLSFILDGEMQDTYPQFTGKPVRLRLECAGMPPEEALSFLQIVHDQTALQGIAFEAEVMGRASARPQGQCGCDSPQGCCEP